MKKRYERERQKKKKNMKLEGKTFKNQEQTLSGSGLCCLEKITLTWWEHRVGAMVGGRYDFFFLYFKTNKNFYK